MPVGDALPPFVVVAGAAAVGFDAAEEEEDADAVDEEDLSRSSF